MFRFVFNYMSKLFAALIMFRFVFDHISKMFRFVFNYIVCNFEVLPLEFRISFGLDLNQ